MERVLVCGGRNCHNRDAVFDALDSLELNNVAVVIHGNAPGADSLGAAWARERLVPQLAARKGRGADCEGGVMSLIELQDRRAVSDYVRARALEAATSETRKGKR